MNYELINVHTAVYLYHLAAQAVGYVEALFGGQFVDIFLEEIVLQVYLLYKKFCVKNIGLIDIHIYGIVLCQRAVIDIILYGSYIVVDKELFAQHISGEAAHAVVDGDDIRIKAGYQIIQRIQRRDSAAGRNIYIHTESRYGVVRVILRESMHRNMAFIKVSVYHLRCIGQSAEIARRVDRVFIQFLLSDKHIHRCALRFIILFRDIEHPRPYHFGDITKYFCEPFGVVLLIDIFDIILLFFLSFGITDIIYIKTQCFCKIIKAVKGDLLILQSIVRPFGESGAKPTKSRFARDRSYKRSAVLLSLRQAYLIIAHISQKVYSF